MNKALEYIKSKHNGEIPYKYGSNECAKLMADYAEDYHQKLVKESDSLPWVRFSSLKNDLLIERQKVKDDIRWSFEEPSGWSHKITEIDARISLICQIEKDEI